jgi:bacterial/archaeal transporter family protein
MIGSRGEGDYNLLLRLGVTGRAAIMPAMKAAILAVLAGLCWGVGEFFTKQVLHTHRVGPITAIAVRSTVALPVLWAVYLLVVRSQGVEPRDWTQAGTATLLKLALGSGLVAGAAGMLCFYGALNLGPISKVKPIAFTLAPVVGTLLGWLVLGETMTATKWVALGLIVVGVVLLTADV